MKNRIKLTENNIRDIIKESVTNIMTEAYNQRQIADQVAKEILGTDTFLDFYRNTGVMVGARDLYLMQQYFKRLAEIESQRENNH